MRRLKHRREAQYRPTSTFLNSMLPLFQSPRPSQLAGFPVKYLSAVIDVIGGVKELTRNTSIEADASARSWMKYSVTGTAKCWTGLLALYEAELLIPSTAKRCQSVAGGALPWSAPPARALGFCRRSGWQDTLYCVYGSLGSCERCGGGGYLFLEWWCESFWILKHEGCMVLFVFLIMV